jgi:hypothetical protein
VAEDKFLDNPKTIALRVTVIGGDSWTGQLWTGQAVQPLPEVPLR